ncbi:MAG TPA: ATP-binding protein [Dokdonella sp.]|nr:ATP-binding protein [Dokdonella sp.]
MITRWISGTPMQHPGRTWPHGPRQLVATLAWLRMCAVAGQALTVLFVARVLELAIPVPALAAGIGTLALFGMFAFWRLRQPRPIGAMQPVAHIAVDTLVLGYLLYLTGGASNPFVSLLVMPITLAATALPLRSVSMVAALSVGTYLLLMRYHVPLPQLSGENSLHPFSLHLTGMAISFAITAGMLGYFIARLARALRAQQAEAELERERALRDEGILAIATQAASTAHELNTPLSTMRTLLGELGREHHADAALSADIGLLASQAERCRDILRELVKVGSSQLAGSAEWISVSALADSTRDAFGLLRPEIEVGFSIDENVANRRIAVVPALHHAIINLLNNAADASLANGDARVELAIDGNDEVLELDVRDYGRGMSAGVRPTAGLRFETTKHDGLGLCLAPANATAERLGGTLIARTADGGGTLQRLRLPLATLDNPHHEH